MSIGQADFSNVLQQQVIGDNSDSAELAVRLGSSVRHFRTGQVIRVCSFEDNDNTALLSFFGAGSAVAKSTDRAMSGSNSLKCTVANVSDAFAGCYFYDRTRPEKTIALSFVLFMNNTSGEFTARLDYDNGTNNLIAIIRYNKTTNKLQLINDAGLWIDIANVSFIGSINFEYPQIMKLIIDVDESKYIKFITNAVDYDLSSYNLFVSSSIGKGLTLSQIYFSRVSSGAQIGYIDDVVLTINEPV